MVTDLSRESRRLASPKTRVPGEVPSGRATAQLPGIPPTTTVTDPRFDIIAIGGGTAGLVTAAGAAGLGARAALVERDRLGGECLWNGCVPSKALLAAAKAAHAARHGERYGVYAGEVRVDWPAVQRHVRDAIRRVEPHDSPDRFRALGVEVVQGTAALEAPDAVRVGDRVLRARHVVVATGSRPAVPPIPGLADVPHLTNESMFDVEALPRRLVVLGAGPIGLEMAQAFARLGSAVAVIEAMDRLLPREDAELATILGASLAHEGVAIALGTKAERVERRADSTIVVHVRDAAGAVRSVEGDALLVATGRRSRTEGFGLEEVGVRTGKEGIEVDERLRTSVPGVWACGDVIGGLRFTHVADAEARLVLRNALFPLSAKRDYRVVPWVTFTEPELAHVGLTEEEARERLGSGVRVFRRPWDDLDRALADGSDVGMLKLVCDAKGRIVGGHVLGRGAGEVIHEIALAMQQKLGAPALANLVHAYPTYSEAARQAAHEYVKSRFAGPVKGIVRWLVRR